jgi:hypothetical protein
VYWVVYIRPRRTGVLDRANAARVEPENPEAHLEPST